MQPIRNFSFAGEPIELELACPHIVLIDPLALDGLSAELQTLSESSQSEIAEGLRDLSGGLRIGLASVGNFRPGRYKLGNEDLEESDNEIASSIADVDSGTICFVDLHHLGLTAKALTWGRYDSFLRSQVGDNSIWMEIVEEVGGPFFGMLSGDVATPFRGDGSYRLKPHAPHQVP